MFKNKKLAILTGAVLTLNGLVLTTNLSELSHVVLAEEDVPPVDEDIPDAQQKKLVKDAKDAIEFLEELKAEGDKDVVKEAIEQNKEKLNGISHIAPEYAAQKAALEARLKKINDWLNPAADAGEIEKEVTETQEIDFETVKEDDPLLEEGKEEEKTPGEKGELTITYKAKFKDGKEVPGTRTKVK